MLGTFVRDFKFAVRSLSRARGFTAIAVLTLALGIGATTTMFSVLDGVLLRPLPYPDADRLVLIGSSSQRFPGLAPVSPADFRDWREQSNTLAEMVATEAWTLDLTDGDSPARVAGAAVSAGFFQLLGTPPLLGRGIEQADDLPGAEPVVVLSHGLWERRYGSDPSIVGGRIITADRTFTVAGVMPPSFVHPEALWSDGVELWLPTAQTGSDMETRNGRFLQVMGRLAPGSSLFQARQEMTAIAHRLAEEYPQNVGREALLEPLQSETVGDVGQALLLLMGAVAMLLLVACVNVANLFLVRAMGRRREIAVRSALGAGTARLRSQLLAEGVALSSLGGSAGVLLAYVGVRAFRAIDPGGIPRVADVLVDGRVLGFAVLVSLLTGVAFAMAPALRMGRSGDVEALKEGGRGGGDGRSGKRYRHLLVAVELGLAVVLTVGAGLFVNSFLRLRNVDPGFDVDGSVTMSLNLHAGYGTPEEQLTFFQQLTERLESIPESNGSAYTSSLPFGGDRWITGIRFEDREVDPANRDAAEYSMVSPGFFTTMGIDVVAGREFGAPDDVSAEPVGPRQRGFRRPVLARQRPPGPAGGHRRPRSHLVHRDRCGGGHPPPGAQPTGDSRDVPEHLAVGSLVGTCGPSVGQRSDPDHLGDAPGGVGPGQHLASGVQHAGGLRGAVRGPAPILHSALRHLRGHRPAPRGRGSVRDDVLFGRPANPGDGHPHGPGCGIGPGPSHDDEGGNGGGGHGALGGPDRRVCGCTSPRELPVRDQCEGSLHVRPRCPAPGHRRPRRVLPAGATGGARRSHAVAEGGRARKLREQGPAEVRARDPIGQRATRRTPATMSSSCTSTVLAAGPRGT